MTTKLNENTIELALIDQLVSQGYTYFYGPDIAPYSDNAQRENFALFIFEDQFKESLKK